MNASIFLSAVIFLLFYYFESGRARSHNTLVISLHRQATLLRHDAWNTFVIEVLR